MTRTEPCETIMPAESTNAVPTCRFSEADASDILLAEAAEAHFSEAGIWTDADQARATRDARELAGERRTPDVLLPLRARLVLARLKSVLPDPDGIRKLSYGITPFTVALMLAAYAAGALTDRLSTDGARINLLAVPLLLVVVWNLAVYAVLLLKALHLLPSSALPAREAVVRLLSGLRLPRLKDHALKMRYVSLRTAAELPRLRLAAARAFHLAAAAFAVGILTGVLVRGIGTAWIVGWESTWFADSPELVRSVISLTYGLIPAERFGLPPIPDSAGIAALRFDLAPTADQAAPWLLRLMLLLSGVVILPRLLLALWDTVLIARAEARITLALDTPYFRRMLADSTLPLCRTDLVVETADPAEADREDLRQLSRALSDAVSETVGVIAHNAWEEAPEAFIGRLLPAQRRQLCLIVDPAATPEDEVHGTFIEAAARWCREHQSPAPAVIPDCASLRGRPGGADARLALWETFIAERHGIALPADLSRPEEREKLIASLKALWR
ncbi:MAG: DUF2868 domain-containing protein [Sutterella sp.]|nr:DUF2868 domain-containing protein [Sutterella sp.]